MKPKILHVGNHYFPCVGGIERTMQDICKALSERGYAAGVLCLDRCADSANTLKPVEKIENILVRRVPFLDLKYYKIAPFILGEVKNYDIVHIHGIGFFSDFLLLTKFLHGKKIIISTHGGIFHTKKLGLLKHIYFGIIQGFLLHFADKIVAISKNDLELFRKISDKVTLIENGVDISDFTPAPKEKNSFLFVGRFSENKRVELLLENFARVKNKGWKLIIAGTDWGKLLAKYIKDVQNLGISKNVVFIINPSREKTVELYSKSEFFVSASQYEGFGLALVEAMASGCIPIVQNNDGFGNIVTDGENGFLTEFNESVKASERLEAISRARGNKLGKISLNAIKRAQNFSWDEKVEMLEKIYKGEGKEIC